MPLLGITEKTNRTGAQGLHRKGKVRECVVPRQRLANEAKRAHVKWRRAARFWRGMGEPAIAAELPHEIAAGGVEITVRAALGISRAC